MKSRLKRRIIKAKKIFLAIITFIAILLSFNVKAKAYYITPPYGVEEVPSLYWFDENLGIFEEDVVNKPFIKHNGQNHNEYSEKYRVIQCSKLLSIPVYYFDYIATKDSFGKVVDIDKIYFDVMESQLGSSITRNYSYSESVKTHLSKIKTFVYESEITTQIKSKIAFSIVNLAEATVENRILTAYNETLTEDYSYNYSNTETFEFNFVANLAGKYSVEERALYKAYLIQEIIVVYDVPIIRLPSSRKPDKYYLVNQYVDLVPTGDKTISMEKYIPTSDGFVLDPSIHNDLDQVIYI